MRRARTWRNSPRAAHVYLGQSSGAASGERGGASAGYGHVDGFVHVNQYPRLRGKLEVFALAREDVNGVAGKAQAEAARDVAEDRADESAAAGTDSPADDVALDVVLFLNDLAFFNFHVFAALGVRLPARLLDGDDAHPHRDEAAIDLDGAEREVHVRLAAKDGEAAGLFDRAHDSGQTRTSGQQQLAPEVDRLGDDGDERVTILCYGAADAA